MTQAGHGSRTAPPTGAWVAYVPAVGAFDETFAEGRIRAHWEPLFAALAEIGPSEFRTRQESARRILREHEAIHNGRADHEGNDRPWDLDLVPLILPAEEWSELEQGLVQRSRLLNFILADLYGPRRAIEAGVLPAEVVQSNPAFLRACAGLRMPVPLFLHGTELARAPDGGWWVVADYAQAAPGLGYALEHRGVSSRLLPEAFRPSHARPLERFIRFIRDELHAFPREAGETPKVVLLAGAPGHEHYFEHAYLSRHLGLPLVEGEDLTVRGDRVYLKTLSGLQRVHVVLRLLDDARADPLELDAASTEGVPGLLEATRAGQVVVVNPPGSALVEAPAMMAFLPGLCRFHLGEELRIPSVATWWCGQPGERSHVLDNLDGLIVRPAFGLSGADETLGDAGGSPGRAISEAPGHFVGQEEVHLSCAPTWVSSGIAPWPMRLRTFTCWSATGAMVLPGGLARVWNPAETFRPTQASGGAGKDTWVLSTVPVAPADRSGAWTMPTTCERVDTELPSRVADNLFWLGRYIERLEDTVRVLRCALVRLCEDVRDETSAELKAVARLLVRLDLLPAAFAGPFSMSALDRELEALTRRHHRLGTVPDLIDRLRRIALVVRDRFSSDTWRIFNQLQADPRVPAGRRQATQPVQLLNTLLFDLAAFSGLQLENMTRGAGWRFLDLGRRMERAVNMITLSQAVLELEAANQSAVELMLEIADSTMTYRRRYFAAPQLPAVLDLLWLDGTNPRSLLFQLEAVLDHLLHLPEDLASARSVPGSDAVHRGRATLRAMDLADLLAPQALEPSGTIPRALAGIAADLRHLSEALTQRYFSHSQTRCSST
jgi:uncharacterized circularly permuted ATP-grasp superfamily protein/uncharacterized alpha-E superfamily protein